MTTHTQCPICGKNFGGETFPFPRLSAKSRYAGLAGNVHIDCLSSHPERAAIERELTETYMKAFQRNAEQPIAARDNHVLIQYDRVHDFLIVHDFEDFAEFYAPTWQVEGLKVLKLGEHLDLGVNRLLTLVVGSNGQLSVQARGSASSIALRNLPLSRLQSLITKASQFVEKEAMEVGTSG